MSDMKCPIKCPICGEMLQKYGEVDPDTGTSIVLGANCPKCGIGDSDIKLWQEFIRTRKTLDVAVDEITKIKVAAESVGIGFFMTAAIFALAKIKTALEQKDVK